jgi:hypothetical protein
MSKIKIVLYHKRVKNYFGCIGFRNCLILDLEKRLYRLCKRFIRFDETVYTFLIKNRKIVYYANKETHFPPAAGEKKGTRPPQVERKRENYINLACPIRNSSVF